MYGLFHLCLTYYTINEWQQEFMLFIILKKSVRTVTRPLSVTMKMMAIAIAFYMVVKKTPDSPYNFLGIPPGTLAVAILKNCHEYNCA